MRMFADMSLQFRKKISISATFIIIKSEFTIIQKKKPIQILPMSQQTSFIKQRNDAWRTRLFDQITNCFVVKVLDWSPFDAFANIFFLFSFQRQLNEHLLKLFICPIDYFCVCVCGLTTKLVKYFSLRK